MQTAFASLSPMQKNKEHGEIMSNPILNTIFKYPYDADLRLSFADEMLCEILTEKVELLKKSSLKITAAADTLEIEAFLIRIGVVKPKSVIKLKYDKFQIAGQEALLIFKIDNAKIITFLLNSIISALKKIGKKYRHTCKLAGQQAAD